MPQKLLAVLTALGAIILLWDAFAKGKAGYLSQAADRTRQPLAYWTFVIMVLVFLSVAVMCIFVPSETMTAWITSIVMKIHKL
ncbi:MAG: hypothetical protein ACXU8O_07725 [Asticcacaulis sp.]